MKYAQEFEHVEQTATNRMLPYIGTQGRIQLYFRPAYLSQDIGQLFEYVTSILKTSKRPLVYAQIFCLINAYSKFWQRSRGLCPPPQVEVFSPVAGLVFTFALGRKTYDENTQWDPKYKIRYTKWSYAWGSGLQNISQYFTVSVPYTVMRHCKIKPIMNNNMRYIYNVMSMLTKCWIAQVYSKPFLSNMYYNFTTFYDLPFEDLLVRHTVQHLPYNRYVWEHATNLITRSIDYNVSLFYFLYIHKDYQLAERTEGDLNQQVLFGETSILSFLRSSIEEYNSNRSAENLVLVAALYGKYYAGPDYYLKLKNIHYSSNLNLDPDDAEHIIKGLITDETVEEL